MNGHALLGESGKLSLVMGHKMVSGEWREW